MRKGRKRLAVDIPIHTHTDLKELAAVYNVTMTKLVKQLIVKLVKEYKGEA